ncbi:MAG: cytochrome c, partial [Hyphomicrobiales bacterium]|nr:cytochrome c [Hyphomicrobiales bacterium]
AGRKAFQTYCAECHGMRAGGTDAGPPLIHPFYRPDHHGDQAFYAAAGSGVRAHHWSFGDMPPVEGISLDEVTAIIAFVRTVQRANKIY